MDVAIRQVIEERLSEKRLVVVDVSDVGEEGSSSTHLPDLFHDPEVRSELAAGQENGFHPEILEERSVAPVPEIDHLVLSQDDARLVSGFHPVGDDVQGLDLPVGSAVFEELLEV